MSVAQRPCFFASLGYDGCEWRFDGQPDPAHLIPAQRIKNAGLREHAYDARVWVWACRAHHDRFDGRNALNKITLAYEEYPPSVRDFAGEFGFIWAGRDRGWVKAEEQAA